ncbi:MAG: MauE/DoxX family redox-associated membrane protein [Woeseiaceae bacterium]
MLDPLIAKAISIGLALMFLIAAYHKFAEGPEFRATLFDYQVLPPSLVPLAARVIPVVELLLGGSWLVSYYQQSLTAVGSAVLLGIYALAIGINLARGRLHIDCGCGFGGRLDNEQFISGGLVFRNLILMVIALLTLLPVGARALGIADYVTLFAVVLVSILLFAAANQLIANRASINTWRKGHD